MPPFADCVTKVVSTSGTKCPIKVEKLNIDAEKLTQALKMKVKKTDDENISKNLSDKANQLLREMAINQPKVDKKAVRLAGFGEQNAIGYSPYNHPGPVRIASPYWPF